MPQHESKLNLANKVDLDALRLYMLAFWDMMGREASAGASLWFGRLKMRGRPLCSSTLSPAS